MIQRSKTPYIINNIIIFVFFLVFVGWVFQLFGWVFCVVFCLRVFFGGSAGWVCGGMGVFFFGVCVGVGFVCGFGGGVVF